MLEAMWTRWLPHMVRIRELIAAGALGEVRTVIADHNQKLPLDPDHRLRRPALGRRRPARPRHLPGLVRLGRLRAPATVHRDLQSPTATGVDRQTAILLGYADGQQAVLHTALDTRGPEQGTIIGTEGRDRRSIRSGTRPTLVHRLRQLDTS